MIFKQQEELKDIKLWLQNVEVTKELDRNIRATSSKSKFRGW